VRLHGVFLQNTRIMIMSWNRTFGASLGMNTALIVVYAFDPLQFWWALSGSALVFIFCCLLDWKDVKCQEE